MEQIHLVVIFPLQKTISGCIQASRAYVIEWMSSSTTDAYAELTQRSNEIFNLGAALSVLHWDQQVMMPEGGTPARSKTTATIQSPLHERVGKLLDAVDPDELEEIHRANIREMRRQYERHEKTPNDLVELLAETTSNAHPN